MRHEPRSPNVRRTMRILLSAAVLCLIPMISIPSNLYEEDSQKSITIPLSSEQLGLYNPLMKAIDKKINQSKMIEYNEKIKDGIENILPLNASRYWLVFDFITLYSNGGMQHALLTSNEEIPFKTWQLEKTVEAFYYYQCHELAAYLEKLIPKSIEWIREEELLIRKEDNGEKIPETEYAEIWGQVDKHNDPFGELLNKEKVFKAIFKDIQHSPESYLKQ